MERRRSGMTLNPCSAWAAPRQTPMAQAEGPYPEPSRCCSSERLSHLHLAVSALSCFNTAFCPNGISRKQSVCVPNSSRHGVLPPDSKLTFPHACTWAHRRAGEGGLGGSVVAGTGTLLLFRTPDLNVGLSGCKALHVTDTWSGAILTRTHWLCISYLSVVL